MDQQERDRPAQRYLAPGLHRAHPAVTCDAVPGAATGRCAWRSASPRTHTNINPPSHLRIPEYFNELVNGTTPGRLAFPAMAVLRAGLLSAAVVLIVGGARGQSGCTASDKRLVMLQETVCASIGGENCPTGNITAHGDWPVRSSPPAAASQPHHPTLVYGPLAPPAPLAPGPPARPRFG